MSVNLSQSPGELRAVGSTRQLSTHAPPTTARPQGVASKPVPPEARTALPPGLGSSMSSTGVGQSRVTSLLAAADAARTQLGAQIAGGDRPRPPPSRPRVGPEWLSDPRGQLPRVAGGSGRGPKAPSPRSRQPSRPGDGIGRGRRPRRPGPGTGQSPARPRQDPGDEAVRAGSALIDATRLRDQDADRLQAGELTSSSM